MDIRGLLGKFSKKPKDNDSGYTSMTRFLVNNNVFKGNPFQLLDVGCSGGISDFWRVFEPDLLALGIDPVISECQRLNAAESNSRVRYRPAMVGLPDDHPFVLKRGKQGPWGGNPWNRLSAHAASQLLEKQIPEEDKLSLLNDWEGSGLVSSNPKMGVDDLVEEEKIEQLDFIKVDVDGYDLDVILSAETTVRQSPVLGFTLEVNFYGSPSDTDHTFHNTDRLMRQWGFDLFGLTMRRYSVATLPALFEWDFPGQTIFGRPYQGDAVYLRDPMAIETAGAPKSPELDSLQLLKLACLFECFGLPDHAAELIQGHKLLLGRLCNPEELLNILTVEVNPSLKTHSELLGRFYSDPSSFFRSRQSSTNND